MKIFYYTFIALIIIISSDLNGFVSVLFHTEAYLSVLILVLTLFLFLKILTLRNINLPIATKWIFFLFFYWLLIGTLIYYLVSPSYGNPIEKIRYYIPSVLLLYTASNLFIYFIKNGKFDQLMFVISISLLMNCIFIIYSDSIGASFNIEEDSGGRKSGLIVSINQAGVTSSIAQLFILYQYLILYKSKKNKWFIILAYFIAVYAGFLTFSKAAFLNILINLIIFLYFLRLNKSTVNEEDKVIKRNKRTIFSIIVFGFLFIVYKSKNYIENLSKYQIERIDEFFSLLNGDINSETTTGRSDIGKIAIEIIKEDSYMGKGLSTFHSIPKTGGYGTHNTYLLLLGEIGFVGLLIYLGFFIVVFVGLKRVKTISLRFLVIGLSSVLLITSMISHNVLYIKLYILIFSLLGVLKLAEKRIKNY